MGKIFTLLEVWLPIAFGPVTITEGLQKLATVAEGELAVAKRDLRWMKGGVQEITSLKKEVQGARAELKEKQMEISRHLEE